MKLLKFQHWHFLLLLILLTIIYFIVLKDSQILEGELFNIKTATWFIIAILSPIVHQIYVLICWRSELYNKYLTKAFRTSAFKLYKFGFAILILSRILTISLLSISNSNTLSINRIISYSVALIIFIPAIYLFYSVKKYFGMDRAFGIDHFQPEKYKFEPFVKKGIFKYTSNGMYIYGFLLLWIPGLIFLSKAAILAALFNHIYIWVHYYFTELPDIKYIYKNE